MNDKPPVYFKVTNAHLQSVYDQPFSVKYSINEWIGPILEGSLLFVFDDLNKAKKFAVDASNTNRLFRCEIEEGKNFRPAILSIFGLEDGKAKDYWNPTFHFYGHKDPLSGTIYAKKVKLTEEINIW